MATGRSKRGAGRGKGKAKLFHKIKDVCELTSTEPYVLRYWEQEFPFLAPEKNKAGHRIYTDEDIELVRRIKKLLYEEGYTTAGARRQLEKERAEGERAEGERSAVEEPSGPAEPSVDVEELERLRGENGALQERIARLEGDRERLLEALQTLREDARALRELVSGAAGGRDPGRPASAASGTGRRGSAERGTASKSAKSSRTGSGRKTTGAKKKTTRKKSASSGKKRTKRKR